MDFLQRRGELNHRGVLPPPRQAVYKAYNVITFTKFKINEIHIPGKSIAETNIVQNFLSLNLVFSFMIWLFEALVWNFPSLCSVTDFTTCFKSVYFV